LSDYILVVDDNEGIQRLLYEFLTQEGYYVKEASDVNDKLNHYNQMQQISNYWLFVPLNPKLIR